MPKGYGLGLKVATIPIAGNGQSFSPENGGGSPPGGGSPGSSPGGGGAAGGLGGIGLIGLLLLALALGVPALIATPQDEQAQVQPGDEDLADQVRVLSRGAIAE